tara:strand:- start:2078 stop:2848 length:771 start_codon:yes stop_codon:yes gene_type:complete
MKKPLILVVNDDGITSLGIRRLIAIMNDFGEVVVVAPDQPRSGMSHAITLNSSLSCESVIIDDGPQIEYSCSGTPVDCVKLAINEILERKPDILVSGINHGSNSSINVIYSGTMSAAVEGALENIPSIGFSLLDYASDANFDEAEKFIREIVKYTLKNKLPAGVCLNVNVPKSKDGEIIKGIKVCRQANGNWIEDFQKSKDKTGKSRYFMSGKFINYDEGKDTDEWALSNHFISIVPVKFDVTSHESIIELQKLQS